MEETMQAITHRKYGAPESLRLEDVAKPVPRENEVLVKIHATSANAGVWHMLRAKPFLMRFAFGLLKPKHTILGNDMAGRVEAAGAGVTRFKAGDDVFGDLAASGFGAFAEYACVPEDQLVLKPKSLTFEEAAAVPSSAVTALQGLREKGGIQSGHKVLIIGAAGGVGSFAVQIARALGARVTAVCGTASMDMVGAIGADRVVDYRKEDVTLGDERFDVILDAAAFRPISDYDRVLKPEGRYVFVGGSVFQMFRAMFKDSFLMAQPDIKDLAFIAELLEVGKIKPVISDRFALRDAPQAIRLLEKGGVQGKLVIAVPG